LSLHRSGALRDDELPLFFRALSAVASAESIPALSRGVPRFACAAWALGDLGGDEAEHALLEGLRRARRPVLALLLNLDRLESRALLPFAPMLLESFGLVSFRSQPDDLHLPPTAGQRV